MDYFTSFIKILYYPIDIIYSYFISYNLNESKINTKQKKKIKYDNRFYYLSLLKHDKQSKIEYVGNETHLIEVCKYSIHGLWPQFNKNQYPSYCKNVSFSINNIQPILDDLETCWYSTEEKNEDFWKHEYEKHGSCMFKDMDEYEYFNTALNLYHTAVLKKIPDKFYNENTQKCLIPISQDFKFIQSPLQKETL